jgi:hypothetical protein
VLGQTGSGKSSTTFRVVLSSMARHGYGGLLTCCKRTDAADAMRILTQCGRAKDVIRVTLDDMIPFRINFLEYEHRRSGKAIAEVLVHLFAQVSEIINRGKHHGSNDAFWEQSKNKLLRYGTIVLRAAGQPITLSNLYRLAVESPSSLEERDDDAWREHSYCYACLKAADDAGKDPVEARDFEQAGAYYLQEHPRMSGDTRGSVISTFSAAVSPFLTFPLRDLFQSSTTNFVPEMCENGAILLLDMPVMEHHELGQIAQVLIKVLFYRAMERRDVAANPRPVFLLSDEHQYFLNSPHDAMFFTTARALRVSCTIITQNISNFHAVLPGDRGRAETDSLAANCGTKFFHLQTDSVTNGWAADLIGKSRQWFKGMSTSLPPAVQPLFAGPWPAHDPAQVSANMSQQLDHEVPAKTFGLLRSGGVRHDRHVDAVVFAGGRLFEPTGRPWLITTFRQEG